MVEVTQRLEARFIWQSVEADKVGPTKIHPNLRIHKSTATCLKGDSHEIPPLNYHMCKLKLHAGEIHSIYEIVGAGRSILYVAFFTSIRVLKGGGSGSPGWTYASSGIRARLLLGLKNAHFFTTTYMSNSYTIHNTHIHFPQIIAEYTFYARGLLFQFS